MGPELLETRWPREGWRSTHFHLHVLLRRHRLTTTPTITISTSSVPHHGTFRDGMESGLHEVAVWYGRHALCQQTDAPTNGQIENPLACEKHAPGTPTLTSLIAMKHFRLRALSLISFAASASICADSPTLAGSAFSHGPAQAAVHNQERHQGRVCVAVFDF
jgi:hypothetical protein